MKYGSPSNQFDASWLNGMDDIYEANDLLEWIDHGSSAPFHTAI